MQGNAKAPDEIWSPNSLQRRCAAAIATMAWFGVGYELYYNITEAVAKKLPMTEHLINFFSYFTIETNLIIAVVLTFFCAWPQAERFLTGPSLSAALVVYVIVVGVVYELLLRHLWHPQGLRLFADTLLPCPYLILYSGCYCCRRENYDGRIP